MVAMTKEHIKQNQKFNKKRFLADYQLYLMVLPFMLYFLIFAYKPMIGLKIAFQDYSIFKGNASPWVGFDNFTKFFSTPYFGRILRNTLMISGYSLIFSFPAPIILALLLNEVRSKKYKSFVQTATYLPHFVSAVVVCGMVTNFLAPTSGIVNIVLNKLGFESVYFLSKPEYFRTIFIAQGIWQGTGYSSIVYLAALGGIDMELYEAAQIDGANDLLLFFRIILPLSVPIIAVMVLFYGVGYWNSWFQAMMYIRTRSKYPLQLVLREILLMNNTSGTGAVASSAGEQYMLSESIKYATIMVATVPILLIYPFIQKYFVKGMMIGAVKG